MLHNDGRVMTEVTCRAFRAATCGVQSLVISAQGVYFQNQLTHFWGTSL